MRISKKIIAAVLAALMVIAMMPISALAEFDIGDNTYVTAEPASYCVYVHDEEELWEDGLDDADLIHPVRIVLSDDVDLEHPFVIDEDWYIQLDLNGHSLSGNISDAEGKKLIQNHGRLEFIGSNGGCIYNTNTTSNGHAACQTLDGGITIVDSPIYFGDSDTDMTNANTTNRGCGIQNEAGGTLIINDGYYTAIDANYTTSAWAYAILNYTGGTTVINNATVYGNALHGAIGCEGGTITVNGGTYAVNGTNNFYSLYTDDGGAITVNGGTFTDNSKNGVNYVGTGSAVTITGGTFTYASTTPFVQKGSKANPVVSGGTFSGDVTACLADGCYQNASTGTVVSNAVAEVNGNYFADFASAYNAATTGDTITLLADAAIASTITINDGRSIAIDLNGNDLSSTVRMFNVRHGALEFKGTGNVNVTFASANAAVGVYGSTNSADADYASFKLGENVTMNVVEGYGAMIGQNSGKAFGTVLDIDGTINAPYGVYINGSVAETDSANAAAISVSGTVNADNENAAIYAAGYANWTIEDGANITGGSAIYIKAGNMTIGNITAAANGAKAAYKFKTNGADITGDCVIIESCGYPGNAPNVTINGGTFTSVNGRAVESYVKQDDPDYSTASFTRVANVIPSTSTAVFSSDESDLAVDGYKTVYDESQNGYVVAQEVDAINTSSIEVADEITQKFFLDQTAYEEAAGTDELYVSVYYNHNSNANTQDKDYDTDIKAVSTGDPVAEITQAPAQITEMIRINVYASAEDANAGTNAIDTIEYSVYDYCTDLIENYTGEKAEELKELAKSTLDYAAASQTYFNYNTDNMATKDTAGDFYNEVEAANLSSVGGFLYKPTYITRATLVVKSDLEINLLTTSDIWYVNGSIANDSYPSRFLVSQLEKNGSYNVINIKGIAPAKMNDEITVSVNSDVFYFTANTILKVMSKSSNADLATLAKAMYLYGQAADEYFNA